MHHKYKSHTHAIHQRNIKFQAWADSHVNLSYLVTAPLMKSSFDTLSLVWLIVYIKRSHVRIPKLRCTSVPEDCLLS